MKDDILKARQDLNKLREEINCLDAVIIEAVAKRCKLSMQIGEVKQKLGMEVFDPQREEKLSQYHQELSDKYNVSDRLISEIFAIIVYQSRVVQYSNSD